MSLLRDAGYNLELLFVFADEETMVHRTERRAKSTGRITKPDHVCCLTPSFCLCAPELTGDRWGLPVQIKSSRMKSPLVVRQLGRKDVVDRVRLVDNSSDDQPPNVVFDSRTDQGWQEGAQVDVDLYMSLKQS